jgi:MFS transporter, YNFM family, putative membrane transport protein
MALTPGQTSGAAATNAPLRTLLVLVAVTFLDLRILATLLPSITASLQTTAGKVGFAITGQALAFATGQLVFGPLGDRFGRPRVASVAALGFGISVLLSAGATTALQFVLGRVLVGWFSGAIAPLTIAYIGDVFAYEARQAALGRMGVMIAIAFASSASLGGLVTQVVSWRAALSGIGLVGIVLAGALFAAASAPPAPVPAGASTWRGFYEILSQARARRVYALVFCEGVFLWGATNYLGLYLHDRYHLGALATGNALAMMGLGMLAAGLSVGPLRRTVAERGLAGLGGLCGGLGFGLVIAAWHLVSCLVGLFLIGGGSIALISTLQVRATALSGQARGKAVALFALHRFVGFSIGALAIGRLFDRGLQAQSLGVVAVGLALVGIAAARESPAGAS